MKARLISLGEIITPNIMKTIGALTAAIAGKKAASEMANIQAQIGGVLQREKPLLDEFNLGVVSEDEFIERILTALEKATEIRLSPKEFYQAWDAMNPDFKDFAQFLSEAIEYNKQRNQSVTFISATNPINIRFIVKQLKDNNIPHLCYQDELKEISDIPLFTTYGTRKNKTELTVGLIKPLLSNAGDRSALAKSMDDLFNSPISVAPDVKYIRGVNKIDDTILATLKDKLDQTNEAIEQQANVMQVEVVIWKKWEKQPLSEALNSTNQPLRYAPVQNL